MSVSPCHKACSKNSFAAFSPLWAARSSSSAGTLSLANGTPPSGASPVPQTRPAMLAVAPPLRARAHRQLRRRAPPPRLHQLRARPLHRGKPGSRNARAITPINRARAVVGRSFSAFGCWSRTAFCSLTPTPSANQVTSAAWPSSPAPPSAFASMPPAPALLPPPAPAPALAALRLGFQQVAGAIAQELRVPFPQRRFQVPQGGQFRGQALRRRAPFLAFIIGEYYFYLCHHFLFYRPTQSARNIYSNIFFEPQDFSDWL